MDRLASLWTFQFRCASNDACLHCCRSVSCRGKRVRRCPDGEQSERKDEQVTDEVWFEQERGARGGHAKSAYTTRVSPWPITSQHMRCQRGGMFLSKGLPDNGDNEVPGLFVRQLRLPWSLSLSLSRRCLANDGDNYKEQGVESEPVGCMCTGQTWGDWGRRHNGSGMRSVLLSDGLDTKL